jgi:hypothetical protein
MITQPGGDGGGGGGDDVAEQTQRPRTTAPKTEQSTSSCRDRTKNELIFIC